jgi:hypothetical protein
LQVKFIYGLIAVLVPIFSTFCSFGSPILKLDSFGPSILIFVVVLGLSFRTFEDDEGMSASEKVVCGKRDVAVAVAAAVIAENKPAA